MAALSPILRSAEGGRLHFHCPGCKEPHGIQVGEGPGPRWGWNGNVEKPTLTPSVLVTSNRAVPPVTLETYAEWKRAPWPQTKVAYTCHSYVADGRIQFLGDCTHELANQTVDLPPWPGFEG